MKTIFILAIATVLAVPASAATVKYTAAMTGPKESTPTDSKGTGPGSVSINGNELSVSVSWKDLTGPAVAGHIHCCAEPGSDGPPAIMLMPKAAASGSLEMKVDLSKAGSYGADFLKEHGGTAAGAQKALVDGLAAGEGYINLHTAKYPPGEIRGQLKD